MKKVTAIISSLLLLASMQVTAQSWLGKIGKRVKEKVVEKVEQHIDDKTDETTGKVLDKAESLGKKTGKKGEQQTSTLKGKSNNGKPAVAGLAETDAAYLKYDFVPGNEVIFEDDLKGERLVEFPSKWDLMEGNAEIAQLNGENTLAIIGYTYITPLFKDRSYKLPEEFTIEFDVFLDGKEGETSVELMNANADVTASTMFWIDNTRILSHWVGSAGEQNSEETFDNSPGWHHFALSFNKRAMKVYMDAKRVANIPNVGDRPVKMKLFARGPEDNRTIHFKSFRIAKGAVPLYDKLLTDGKIITYGITFDVGKSTIKPESMGTINEVFGILQQHPELKFSVEGHTDNTGNATLNQSLSESRAQAVCDKLQQMGIGPGRLIAKGHGMSKPLDSNATPEGRAKNRRVEFVKQ